MVRAKWGNFFIIVGKAYLWHSSPPCVIVCKVYLWHSSPPRKGISNLEDGCYAKLIDLDKEAEPIIAAAMSMEGTVIENVPPLPGLWLACLAPKPHSPKQVKHTKIGNQDWQDNDKTWILGSFVLNIYKYNYKSKYKLWSYYLGQVWGF